MKKTFMLVLTLAVGLSAFTASAADGRLLDTFGPKFKARSKGPKPKPKKEVEVLRRWSNIIIDASGYDHGAAREQLGPGRAARATAIGHIAMYDVVVAIHGKFESYTGIKAPKGGITTDAAIAQAAHDTLVELYPAQADSFDEDLAEDLERFKNGKEKVRGIQLGAAVAFAIMQMRFEDGSAIPEPRMGIDWIPSELAGRWRQDPISQIPLALGAHWYECAPFVVESASQFRCPPFPAMDSPEYTAAYNEVKRLGGDGVNTPTERTPEQSFIGVFWAYDGTPSLCAPPRLYNQIVLSLAEQTGLGLLDLARLLAVANASMADATLNAWDSKFHYDIWRPITGIREADAGTGPGGIGDDNPDTVGDPTFSPLGAPASNLHGPNFTPPFPAYPSGHATMGGALFQTLRRFYGTDRFKFTFVSDEFNGVTRANDGRTRPLIPRRFNSFSEAEEENGQSRIYLGIHWSFDKTEGIAMGRKVADYVIDNAFGPVGGHKPPKPPKPHNHPGPGVGPGKP